MIKYRKKPVVIEAIEWDETVETFKHLKDNGMESSSYIGNHMNICDLKISTLEGPLRASKGDYIIKGVNGEFYPCKPDIFMKTYEQV